MNSATSSKLLNACFNGCSFTWGAGFAPAQREFYIYDRLISTEFNFDRTNIAIGAASNYVIFMNTIEALQQHKYDIMFVQWTGLNRLCLSPGPETWARITGGQNTANEFRYHSIHITKKEMQQFTRTVLVLNQDYQNILDLINYCDVLNKLASMTHTKIVFINGLVHWQRDLDQSSHQSLSAYTKYGILDFDYQTDDNVTLYFNKIKQKFSTLDQSKWVNLFDPFQTFQVDKGPEGHHPGIKSHAMMAEKISHYLHNENIL